MPGRPVSGICERCRRQDDLLIPEPGAKYLSFESVSERFAWCDACSRVIGRACCWTPDQICEACARSGPPTENVGAGFAEVGVARAAVRRLDAAGAGFSRVEARIDGTATGASGAARDAWEDAWLGAAVLRLRIDSTRRAVTAGLQSLPAGVDDAARELERELDALTEEHDGRWRSLTLGLTDAGRRFAMPDVPAVSDGPRDERDASIPPGTPLGSEPTATAVAVATAPPVLEAEGVATLANAASRPSPTMARVAQAAGQRGALTAISARPGRAPQPVATEGQTDERGTGPALPSVPATHPVRSRSISAITPIAAGVLALVLGGGLLAGVLSGALDRIGPRATSEPDLGAAASPTASAGVDRSTAPSATAVASLSPAPLIVTFDLQRMGPLVAAQLPGSRLIGAPEVVAIPSPFDRSLRLAGAATGICLEGRGSSGIAFDLFRDDAGSGGLLRVGLESSGDRRAMALIVELDSLARLPRGSWYRIHVVPDGAAGRAVVTDPESGREVLAMELGTDTAGVSPADGETCLQAALATTDASLLADNLRVDR